MWVILINVVLIISYSCFKFFKINMELLKFICMIKYISFIFVVVYYGNYLFS